MLSLRARKDGNVYSIHKNSSESARNAMAIRIRPPIEIASVKRLHYAPDGDAELCARSMKVLVDAYPGYTWSIIVDDRPTVGTLSIMNAEINSELFANQPYGYVLKLTRIYADPNLNCIKMAAGEILERANLSRGVRRPGEEIICVDGVQPEHQPKKGIIYIGQN